MSPVRAIVRNELRILRHDPVPLVLLVGMPIVLMTLLSQSLGHVLLFEGYDDTPGSMHTAPGMACLFGFFSIAIVGFAIFREHGWRTWPRLRAAGISGPALLAGKLTVPAVLLVLQHVVLFGFGVLALGFKVNGAVARGRAARVRVRGDGPERRARGGRRARHRPAAQRRDEPRDDAARRARRRARPGGASCRSGSSRSRRRRRSTGRWRATAT